MGISQTCGFQNREALWSVDSHVHLYCYKHGYGTLSGHPVLLWAWQDGKFHKGGQRWIRLYCCRQSFQSSKCQPHETSYACLQLIQLV